MKKLTLYIDPPKIPKSCQKNFETLNEKIFV